MLFEDKEGKVNKKGGNMIRQRNTEGRQNYSTGEDREAGVVGKDLLKMLLGLQSSYNSEQKGRKMQVPGT